MDALFYALQIIAETLGMILFVTVAFFALAAGFLAGTVLRWRKILRRWAGLRK